MKQFIVALVLALVLSVSLALAASAAYVPVTFAGQTWNYCDHVRGANAHFYGCDAQ